MKKIISAIISAAMLFSAVSCASGSNKDSSNTQSAVQSEQMSLKAADIEMAQDFESITTLDRNASSGNVLIFGVLKNGEWCGYVTDESFSDRTEFRITPDEDEAILGAAMLSFGKKAVLSWQDGTTRITVFDRDNQQESVIECEDVIGDPTYYTRIFSDGDGGFIILADDRLAAVSADGEYRGDISTGGLMVNVAAKTEDGVTCMLSDRMEMYLADIDIGTLSLQNKRSCGKMNSSAIAMCAGVGEYELAAIFYDGLYGLMDGSLIKLCDFMDNDFSVYEIMGLVMTGENEFAAVISTGMEVRLSLLTERDISEIKAKKVIKIAANRYWVQDMVKHYNSENEDGDYRVEVIDYFSLEPDSLTVDDLKRDMISGNAPDILLFSQDLPIDTFGAKETMFVDLYTLLDKDPDLSREDFLPNILEGLERGGKLLQISETFEFNTIMARPGYEGVKENWSISDMITAYENLPEGTYMFPDTDKYLMGFYYTDIVQDSFFVDFDKAECYFDSPEYISLLNFLIDNKIGRSYKELGDSAYFRPAETDQEGIDVVGTFGSKVFSFGSIHSVVKGKYKDEVVFAGYPFDGNRCGSFISSAYRFGIMANSENIDGAWDFIKTFFSDYYYDNVRSYAFPTRIDRFNEQCDDYTRDWTYTDPKTGEEVTEKRTYTPKLSIGEFIWIDNFTPEECEYYKNIVLSAPMLENDNTISRICIEETDKLFEGECTAEECAEMIQNRVSLYLSEHYQ